MDENENWRIIHDGYYEVSNLGNVRRAKPGIATFVGRPCLPVVAGNGYAVVTLGGPTPKRAYIHHLVAEAFIGPRPDGAVINHLNGCRSDNAAANLAYVSRSENAVHAINAIGRRKGPTKPPAIKVGRPTGDKHWTRHKPDRVARGSRMPHSKLTADLVRLARERVALGEMQKDLARDLGVSVAQMSRIVRGTRWTYVR